MDEYTEVIAEYPNAKQIDFIGHSNGTTPGCDRANAKDFGGYRTIFGPGGHSVPIMNRPEA